MNQPYHLGFKLLLLNVALGLGTFMQILDTSIANVAIPYIAGSLAVSPDEGTWVITSFAVSNAIVLPLTGWLSDYFGKVKLFVYSVILFAITSFFCGFSSSLAMLVFFRVLQGAVAGSLIPLSQGLLVLHNPDSSRGSALGFWAMIVVVAPVLGPILGGYVSEEYSWPWIFYINIPIGAFSAFIAWSLLKDRESVIKRDPIDWSGLALLSLGVACLQIMLDRGKDLDWFESNTIWALLITAIIALAYFTIWNLYQAHPIVDFSFFRDRNFLLGNIVTMIGYLFFFGSTVVMPLWLQLEQGYTPFWAGVAVAPIGILPVFLSPLVGKYLNYFDVRALASASFFLFGIGYYYQSLFTTQVDLYHLMLARFIQGIGVSIFFIPLVQLSLGNISNDRFASASGIFNFIRILFGSGFGTALSIQLWTHLEIFHHARLSEAITAYRPAAVGFYDYLKEAFPYGNMPIFNRVVDLSVEQQAYMLATNDILALAALGFFLMIPIPFFCNRIEVKGAAVHAAGD